jgi:hypothetical protein
MQAFNWLEAGTITVSATTTSSDNPLGGKVPAGRFQLRVYNAGAVPVFIRKGSGGAAATAVLTDMPIAPGAVEVLSVDNSPSAPITSIGAITGSGTATLYVTIGEGL